MGSLQQSRRSKTLSFYLSLFICIFILIFLLFPSSAKRITSKLPTAANSRSNTFSARGISTKTQNTKADKKPPPPSVIRYPMNNVTTSSDPVGNRETVLLLTPMTKFYQEYWDNLMRLSYPRGLITLGFIVPKNRQGNLAIAALQEQITKVQKFGPAKDRFGSIIIERQQFDHPLLTQGELGKDDIEGQKARRVAMSKARNSLLFTTLDPAISWVLWIDADIGETPSTLIQDLASHNKPILVPNCFQRRQDPHTKKLIEQPYNFNSWQESDASKKLSEELQPDDVLMEGSSKVATRRTLMAYMATDNGDPRTEVVLDGIGGNVILVKAEVHRDGAMFPPFAFYNLIEAEGFAKMARRLGWNSTGLPNYKVYHCNESKGLFS